MQSEVLKMMEYETPLKTIRDQDNKRKKTITVVTGDLLLQDELDEILDNDQFFFSTVYEIKRMKQIFERDGFPSIIILDYDTIKILSTAVYKLKEIAPLSPIILLSRKEIDLKNVLFESTLFYGTINEIYKNKEQFKLLINSASNNNFTNILVEKNTSILDTFLSGAEKTNLTTIDSTIYNIISQIKVFSDLDDNPKNIDFLVLKNQKSTSEREVIGTSGSFDILKKKKRKNVPKDIEELINKTLLEKQSNKTENLESMYFFDNIDYETIFIFKNLKKLNYGSKKIFNFTMYNSSLILSKIYEIEDREKECLKNIITINEVLKGNSIDQEIAILEDLNKKCRLNDFQKEQIINVFHIYDLEKTLYLFKRTDKSILTLHNKSLIDLVKEITEQIDNYSPKEHTIEEPTLYSDIIRLVYIIKDNGIKNVLNNKEKYLLPNYIYCFLINDALH